MNSGRHKPEIIGHSVSLGIAAISEILGMLVNPSKSLFYLLSAPICVGGLLKVEQLPADKVLSLVLSVPPFRRSLPFLLPRVQHQDLGGDTREVSSCSRATSSHHQPASHSGMFLIHLKTPKAIRVLLCSPLSCSHALN